MLTMHWQQGKRRALRMFFLKETQRALDKQKICFPRLWVDGMHASVYSSVIDLLSDTTYYHNGKFPPNSEEIIKNCV